MQNTAVDWYILSSHLSWLLFAFTLLNLYVFLLDENKKKHFWNSGIGEYRRTPVCRYSNIGKMIPSVFPCLPVVLKEETALTLITSILSFVKTFRLQFDFVLCHLKQKLEQSWMVFQACSAPLCRSGWTWTPGLCLSQLERFSAFFLLKTNDFPFKWQHS